jgi:WD40 repeat protein
MIRFAISPDSRRVAVAGGSRKTRKYVGMEKNQLKYEDVGEDKPGIISVRDLRTGQEISSFRGHTSPISFVKFLDDKRVCSKSADEKFSRVWDLESGSELQQLKPEFASIPGTKLGWCYAPDAEGKPTKKVALRDAESGEIVRQFESLPNFPRTVNSDRSVAVVATQQYKANDPNPLTVTVSLWDLQSDKLLHELSQSSQVLGAAQFRSAGQLVTVIGETVTIWDVATGQPLERRRIDDGGSFSADAVLSRDGQRILFRVAEPNRHLPMVRSPDTW